MNKEQYEKAYRAVRLRQHVENAKQTIDYTVYDGWRDAGDGYNLAGQTYADWCDVINYEIEEYEYFARRCQHRLNELNVPFEHEQIAHAHWYNRKYGRDEMDDLIPPRQFGKPIQWNGEPRRKIKSLRRSVLYSAAAIVS